MRTATERIAGEFGTVEGFYRANGGKPYRTATEPPRTQPTAVTAQGASPSLKTRQKRADIAKQQSTTERPKRKRKASPQWAQLVGISRENMYGIRVKVRGLSADTYWLPYFQAETLFYDITGCDLAAEVAQL